MTEMEYNRTIWLANLYADGNLAAWLRHAALNADRKFLKKKAGPKKRPAAPPENS